METRVLPPSSPSGGRRTNHPETCHLTSPLLPILQRSDRERGDTRAIIVSSGLHDRDPDGRLFGGAGRCHAGEADGVSKVALVHHSFEIQQRFADGSCRA